MQYNILSMYCFHNTIQYDTYGSHLDRYLVHDVYTVTLLLWLRTGVPEGTCGRIGSGQGGFQRAVRLYADSGWCDVRVRVPVRE